MLTEAIPASLPEGSAVGTISVKIAPAPGGNWPANVAGIGTASIPVTVNGQQATIYIEFVAIAGPQLEAEIQADNVGAPIPLAVVQAAATAVAERVAAVN